MKLWPTNYAMGRRIRDGMYIVFEAWGRVDIRALVDADASTTARLEKTQLYRDELLNVLLVESSYRERRVLHSVLLVDAGGMTSEHAKLLRFLETVRFIGGVWDVVVRVRPFITCGLFFSLTAAVSKCAPHDLSWLAQGMRGCERVFRRSGCARGEGIGTAGVRGPL